MTPEEAARRANEAERLMADPMLKDALDLMEREVSDAWLACPVRDVEGREAAWRLAVTTRKFRDLLRGTIEAGKLARKQIEERKSFVDRTKAAINQFRR